MIAGDQDDRCVWESLTQTLELPERENDRVVGGADRVKEIAGDDHDVRPRLNYAVDGGAESLSDIGFPLVDAARRLPVILPDSEMRIGEVRQFHGLRMGPNALKIKHLR